MSNNIPSCECPNGMTGGPFKACRVEDVVPKIPLNPCDPSPCGSNSLCRIVDGRPTCSCLPEMKGTPPNCRPECVVSSECDLSKSCQNQRCVDSCSPGTCGINALCKSFNHNPVCSCPSKYLGDPFVMCSPIREYYLNSLNFCLTKI